MTSDVGYPKFGLLNDTMDELRCRAVDGQDRRCQLYVDHHNPHAHAWLEDGPNQQPGWHRVRPWRPHIERWTNDEQQWQDETRERLRWCCMFSQ